MFLLLYSIVRIFNKQFSLKFYFKHYFFSVYHLALQFYSNRVLFDPTRGHTATADHSVQVNRLYLYNAVVGTHVDFHRSLFLYTTIFSVRNFQLFQYLLSFTLLSINVNRNTLVLGHSGSNKNWPYDYNSDDDHRRKCV